MSFKGIMSQQEKEDLAKELAFEYLKSLGSRTGSASAFFEDFEKAYDVMLSKLNSY